MRKQRVICDTNIWYRIGSGEIDQKQFQEVELIATWYNLKELATTKNIVYKPLTVKAAAKAMFQHAYYWETNHIAQELIKVNHPNYHYKEPVVSSYLNSLGNFISFTDVELIKRVEEKKGDMIQFKEQKGKGLVDAVNTFNLIKLIALKEEAKKTGKKKIRGMDLSLETALKFKQIVKEYCEEKQINYHLHDESKWEKFEFIFYIDMAYTKHMLIGNNSQMKQNDIIDWANTCYVRPGDLYWTEDKMILRMAKESGVEPYLYST